MFLKFPSKFFPPSTLQKSEENKMNFITCTAEQEVNFIGYTRSKICWARKFADR